MNLQEVATSRQFDGIETVECERCGSTGFDVELANGVISLFCRNCDKKLFSIRRRTIDQERNLS